MLVETAPPEVETSELAKLLNGAVDIIAEYGWVQNHMGNEDIGFCALGALREQFPKWGTGWTEWESNHRLLSNRLIQFNDLEAESKEEVIDYLQTLARK